MAPSHLEVEDKYDVAPDAVLPALDGLPQVESVETSEHRLEATYFDTTNLRLAAAGITVRRRTGGADDGWHLKLPADGARHEITVGLGRGKATVPKRLRETVRVFLGSEALGPIATLRTHRTDHRLLDASGLLLAAVSDDIVTAEVQTREIGWREWEVELGEGGDAMLKAAAALLRDAGARPSTARSKLARAVGDRLTAAQTESATTPGKRDAAGVVVQARLRDQVAELRRRDPLVRQDLPGGVHKMRVATRRLRNALATHRPLLDQAVTEPIRDELKWLAGVLGDARDAEVLQARLTDKLDGLAGPSVRGPVRSRIKKDLGTEYRTAHAAVVETLESDRYFALLDGLDQLSSTPPWTKKAEQPVRGVLPKRVRHDWKRLKSRVDALADEPDAALRSTRLHEVRKAAKRARYADEPLVDVYGKDAKRFVKAMKRIQSLLGEQHDTVAARIRLRSMADHAAEQGEDTFTLGVLHAREEHDGDELEAAFGPVWARARKKKLRRWLS
jgi:CHAD domain-containing protein